MTNTTANLISDLLVSKDITVTVNLAPFTTSEVDDWRADATAWLFTFEHDGQEVTFNYFTGSAIKDEPRAADLLHSLIMDASLADEGFDEFCLNMGHDGTDGVSPQAAAATYAEIIASAELLHDLFTFAEIDILGEMLVNY
jgi:hypothetical protein